MNAGDLQSVLATAGILAAHFLWLWRARKAGLDHALAARVSLAMVIAGLFGAWLFRWVYIPTSELSPRWGLASFGGLAGGLLTALLLLRWRALPYLDALAFVFPAGWILGRLGCAFAGDHPGVLPNGQTVNLGLVETMFLAAILIPLFVWLNRQPRARGFWLGWLMLIYGAFRLLMDQLHQNPPRYAGLSVDQWAYGLFFFSGAAVLLFSGAGGAGTSGGGGAMNSRFTRFPDAS